MPKFLTVPASALSKLEDALAREKKAVVQRRLLGVRLVALQHSVPCAACEVGVSEREMRRWIHAFLDGGVEALQARTSPGRPPLLDRREEERFKERVRNGPATEDRVSTWRGHSLQRMLVREFGVTYELSSVYRLMHRLGFSSIMPRPQHPGASKEEQETFKKNASRCLGGRPAR